MTRPIKRLLLSWRGLAWLAATAGLAAVLCTVPLFDRLGYAFCLALAPLVSIAAAHLGSLVVSRARDDDGLALATIGGGRALAALLARSALIALALLVLPLALIALNALRVRNCAPLSGLGFFALMPLCSALLGGALGTLAGVVIPRPRLATLAALAAIIASFAWGAWRFYDTPAVFAYDPFVGFFAGALYDEAISAGSTLAVYRLHNFAWAVGAALLVALWLDPAMLRLSRRRAARPRPANERRSRRRLAIAALLVGATAVTMFWQRASLGFALSAGDVQHALGGVRHSTHFDIHYPDDFTPAKVDRLVEDHEFRYAQLSAAFGGRAPQRIRSYIFRSAAQKQALMGAANVFIAKPWRGEIYLQADGFPQRALKHELVHVFAAPFGDGLLGVAFARDGLAPRFNVGLIEGLAVALDWRPGEEADVHQRAAALRQLSLAPPVAALMSPGFYGFAGSRAYTVAGSFCRYLLDRFGRDKLLRLYRTAGDFEAVYGKSLAVLAAAHQRFLEGVTVPPRTLQLARERFRRPAIFARQCPHAVANLSGEAQQLKRRGSHDEAQALYRRICRFEPDDPAHLVTLMRALIDGGDRDGAHALVAEILAHKKLSKPLEARVREISGDQRWIRGDDDNAASAYDAASALAAAAYTRRVLHLKRWALRQPPPLSRLLRRYFVAAAGERLSAALGVHLAHRIADALARDTRSARRYRGIGRYLLGKQLAGRDQCRDAIPELVTALDAGLPDADFIDEAQRTLGRCQYFSGRPGDARATFSSLAARASTRDLQLEAREWIERIDWRIGKL